MVTIAILISVVIVLVNYISYMSILEDIIRLEEITKQLECMLKDLSRKL